MDQQMLFVVHHHKFWIKKRKKILSILCNHHHYHFFILTMMMFIIWMINICYITLLLLFHRFPNFFSSLLRTIRACYVWFHFLPKKDGSMLLMIWSYANRDFDFKKIGCLYFFTESNLILTTTTEQNVSVISSLILYNG